MKFSKSTIAAALLFAANHFTLTNAQCRADTHPCIASDGITVGERMCVNLNKKRTNVDKCATPDEQIDFLANPAKQARCDCCNGTCASCSGSTCGNNGQLMCVTGPGKGKRAKTWRGALVRMVHRKIRSITLTEDGELVELVPRYLEEDGSHCEKVLVPSLPWLISFCFHFD
eukprot:g14987.t1 g14987   contig21:293720-294235(-)